MRGILILTACALLAGCGRKEEPAPSGEQPEAPLTGIPQQGPPTSPDDS